MFVGCSWFTYSTARLLILLFFKLLKIKLEFYILFLLSFTNDKYLTTRKSEHRYTLNLFNLNYLHHLTNIFQGDTRRQNRPMSRALILARLSYDETLLRH